MIGLEEGWDSLKREGIDVVLAMLTQGLGNAKPLRKEDFIRIYTKCHDMCVQKAPHNWSPALYERHGETFESYYSGVVVPRLRAASGTRLIPEFVRAWDDHCLLNKWMYRFFMYLDRHFVKHRSVPTLREQGMSHFHDIVFKKFAHELSQRINEEVQRARKGEVVDFDLLRRCIHAIEAMDERAYQVYVELPLLEQTKRYYKQRGVELIETESTPTFLEVADKAVDEEEARAQLLLQPATLQPLLEAVRCSLIQAQMDPLLRNEQSGLRDMLSKNRREDLRRVFRLFRLVEGGLDAVGAVIREHVEEHGHAVTEKRRSAISNRQIKDSASDPAFVQEVLALQTDILDLVADAMGGHPVILVAVHKGLETVANSDIGKHSMAELLCSYCDRLLRAGGEKISDRELESQLERAEQLFGHLADKDVFIDMYRTLLARRLLGRRSKSDDAERVMISRFKARCGVNFTSKLEGMFTDISTCEDRLRGFDAFAKAEGLAVDDLEFRARVLTQGHWPTFLHVDAVLPESMAAFTQAFEKFYLRHSSHRRITWIHSLGSAVVTGRFFKRKHDLEVNTLQALVLLLFNDDKERTAADVAGAVNFPQDVANRVLHSLACGKFQILRKSPPGRAIKGSDTFQPNPKFSSSLRKIRVPLAALESAHSAKKIQDDRSHAIEAAIVRIMKSRKAMDHQQLVGEVLSQLATFRPENRAIKRGIEKLIEREYLERDPDTAGRYKYLA